MGDKITAKEIAERAGVNIIPGHPGPVADADEAAAVAAAIGYPVMLKASAGGGGKGMRMAGDAEACRRGFERATSEARASFGDGRIFIEKFIEEPRHIEIQILGDRRGNMVHLGERECSVQRRHQKVIEEAPSPLLDAEMREAMASQALALARAVGYESAGTVEFVVDAERRFYFLEMNTRLQVEHPVTEFVTGLDLVELMIRIAAGESLPVTQQDVRIEGWAVEARLYAEDPERDFLPSAGRVERLRFPAEVNGLRVDAGVAEGGEVSIYYDPMIAKVIAGGDERPLAIETLRAALDQLRVDGIMSNALFLASILGSKRFIDGDLSTDLIGKAYPDGFAPTRMSPPLRASLLAVATVVHMRYRERAGRAGGSSSRDEGAVDLVVHHDGEYVELTHSSEAGAERIEAKSRGGMIGGASEGASESSEGASGGGTTWRIETEWQPGQASLWWGRVNRDERCIQVRRLSIGYRLESRGVRTDVVVMSPRAARLHALMPGKRASRQFRYLRSPMPGLLIAVKVAPGETVKLGQELAVVEAMKMENTLRAEHEGMVSAIHAAPGDNLAANQTILEFGSAPDRHSELETGP